MNHPTLILSRILGDGPVTWEEVEELTPLTREEAQRYLAGGLADAGRGLLYRLLFTAQPALEAACVPELAAEPPPVVVFHRALAGQDFVLAADDGWELGILPATEKGYYQLRLLGEMPLDGCMLYVDGEPLTLARPFTADGTARVREQDIRPVLDGTATVEMTRSSSPAARSNVLVRLWRSAGAALAEIQELGRLVVDAAGQLAAEGLPGFALRGDVSPVLMDGAGEGMPAGKVTLGFDLPSAAAGADTRLTVTFWVANREQFDLQVTTLVPEGQPAGGIRLTVESEGKEPVTLTSDRLGMFRPDREPDAARVAGLPFTPLRLRVRLPQGSEEMVLEIDEPRELCRRRMGAGKQ